MEKILNLTGHNVKLIVNESESIILKNDGVFRVNIKEEKVGEIMGVDIVKRVIEGYSLEGVSKEDIMEADGVIISAQSVEEFKRIFGRPGLKVYTVGATIREVLPDGSTKIKGAKNLVLN